MEERHRIVSDIDQAVEAGARVEEACKAIFLPPRTYYRWSAEYKVTGKSYDKRPGSVHPAPANKLTEEEQERLRATLHSEEFADKPPCEIVPTLADRGEYICSESTMYRYMKLGKENKKRIARKHGAGKKPRTFVATGPNQVWVWDITYLSTTVKGLYYYFYVFTDIWSRYIVGGEVYEEQSSELAIELMGRIIAEERIDPKHAPVLHSDNGKPMVSQMTQEFLTQYGIFPSHSRPSVSNDNAYAESQFSTAKSRPNYPKAFETLEEAQQWAHNFIEWARMEHHHSGINFLTPDQRHHGQGTDILERRQKVYRQARKQHPERWNGRDTRDWSLPDEVYLNPTKEMREKEALRRKARDKSRTSGQHRVGEESQPSRL